MPQTQAPGARGPGTDVANPLIIPETPPEAARGPEPPAQQAAPEPRAAEVFGPVRPDPTRIETRDVVLPEDRRAALEGSEIRVLNWSGYIAPEVVASFERRHAIRVSYDSYDTAAQARAMLAEGLANYDVAVVPLDLFEELLDRRALRPLDLEALGGYGHLDPDLLDRLGEVDFGNLYAVPYLWGITGLAYDAAQAAARNVRGGVLRSWRSLFDPALVSRFAECGVSLPEAPDEMFQITRRYLAARDGDPPGDPPEDGAPGAAPPGAASLSAAETALRRVRPYIRGFRASQDNDGLLTGEFCLSVMWSGDAARLQRRAAQEGAGVEIRFLAPEEGALLWMDVMVTPRPGARRDAAMRWIDHILEPERAAQIARAAGYASPNLRARDFLDAPMREDPALYPPAQLRARLFLSRRAPDEAGEARAWRRLRLRR